MESLSEVIGGTSKRIGIFLENMEDKVYLLECAVKENDKLWNAFFELQKRITKLETDKEVTEKTAEK
jgi:nitrate reductase assembly molybdenum cofactor insertion protein NarJ